MAATLAKRHTTQTRDSRAQANQVVKPGPSTRKRHRRIDDASNDNDDEHRDKELQPARKRPKLQTESREPQQPSIQKIATPATRRSLRLEKSRELKDCFTPKEDRPLKRSSELGRYRDQKAAQSQKNVSEREQQVKRKQGFSNQGHPQGNSLELSKARKDKRRRNVDSQHEPSRAAKRQRRQSVSGLSIEQADSIERWLDESCSYKKPSIADKTRLLEAVDTMPRKSGVVLPSPQDSLDRTTTSSRKSERTTVSVHDSDYRQSLRYRNINIERENPPTELMRRAHGIISRPRTSPEMDDIAVKELKEKSRQLQEDAEEEIVQQLAPSIIPAMTRLPDQRLARNAHQPWANSVSVPLDSDVLTNPLPLPKPKPDLAFGYSQNAFNNKQLMTIELLVEDEFGQSFAVPDKKLRFPFLDIEFKSQAKGGTHYIATNQTAGAGAIALNGKMELMQRSLKMENFDYDEPEFFSITMDHELARINVHWLKAPVDGGMHSFHVEGLSQHLLKDADGIRAITRAIKNILDYGADRRLRTLCEALDAYRAIVVRDREAANPRKLRHDVILGVNSGQRRRGSGLVLAETVTKGTRHVSILRETSADELVTDQRPTKQGRHRPNTTHNVGISKSNAAPTCTARHTTGNAGKSAYNEAPKRSTRSRHTTTGGPEEPKRRFKPSQNCRRADNTWLKVKE